jgi:hypothetical protein
MRRIGAGRMGQSFQGMGRNSLLFFALGSVASTGGRSLMAAAQSLAASHLSIHAIGLVYTTAMVVGMFLIVNRMDRTGGSPSLATESRNIAARLNALGAAASEGAAASPAAIDSTAH